MRNLKEFGMRIMTDEFPDLESDRDCLDACDFCLRHGFCKYEGGE